jgi:hypothetical protein
MMDIFSASPLTIIHILNILEINIFREGIGLFSKHHFKTFA